MGRVIIKAKIFKSTYADDAAVVWDCFNAVDSQGWSRYQMLNSFDSLPVVALGVR
jgi:hypothetical protein